MRGLHCVANGDRVSYIGQSTLERGDGDQRIVVVHPPKMGDAYDLAGESALPFNVVLNRQMVVQWYKSGGNLDELISQMERLMNED